MVRGEGRSGVPHDPGPKEDTFRHIKNPSIFCEPPSPRFQGHLPCHSPYSSVELTPIRKSKEENRRKGGKWGGGGKEARRGYLLTLTANTSDMTMTYLFVEEHALALCFGLCSLDYKYKRKMSNLIKNIFF